MRTIVLIMTLLLAAPQARSERACVDPEKSKFTIHVDSGGIFSAFAHDHEVATQKISGCAIIDWSHLKQSSVDLVFAAAGIKVMDPDHTKDIPKVQETMEMEVLSLSQFPEIRFKSSAVRSRSPGNLTVDGDLTIRGRTKPITLNLALKRVDPTTTEISGTQILRQSDFGIKPVKVMGGMVRV